jgi:hypothetical protein
MKTFHFTTITEHILNRSKSLVYITCEIVIMLQHGTLTDSGSKQAGSDDKMLTN